MEAGQGLYKHSDGTTYQTKVSQGVTSSYSLEEIQEYSRHWFDDPQALAPVHQVDHELRYVSMFGIASTSRLAGLRPGPAGASHPVA